MDAIWRVKLNTKSSKLKQLAVDTRAKMLLWNGDLTSPSTQPLQSPNRASRQEQEHLSYNPQHLARKNIAARAGIEGEEQAGHRPVADIKDSPQLIRALIMIAARGSWTQPQEPRLDAVPRFDGHREPGDGVDGIREPLGGAHLPRGPRLRALVFFTLLARQAAMA